jgi:hypothetical protein
MSSDVRENRLRRMAQRQGLMLQKTRRRDPRAIDYGSYLLIDPRTNFAVFGIGAIGYPTADLDDIEAYLRDGER